MIGFFQKSPVLLVFPAAFALLVIVSFLQHRSGALFNEGPRDVVLVTGGAGFIGSHTIVQLLASGRRVIAVDNFVNSSPEAVARLRRVAGESEKRLLFYKADVSSMAQMAPILSEHGQVISHVIHFCGLKAVAESLEMPLEYYRDNIDSVLVVVRLMAKHGIPNIVFSSSATVYGPHHASPLRETMSPLSATNPYGRTKLFIEHILSDHALANPSFQAVLLRYFNPIGAHPSGLIGESPRGVPNNLMPYVLQVAAGLRPHLRIFGTDYASPDGTAERDFVHVMDVADGHVAALGLAERGAVAVNLGTGRATSVKQLVACVERAAGKKLELRPEARRPGDLASVVADVSKAARLLSWRATRSIDDACADGWKWQQNLAKE